MSQVVTHTQHGTINCLQMQIPQLSKLTATIFQSYSCLVCCTIWVDIIVITRRLSRLSEDEMTKLNSAKESLIIIIMCTKSKVVSHRIDSL